MTILVIGDREYKGKTLSIMNKKLYVDGVVVEEGIATIIVKGDAVAVKSDGSVAVVGNVKGDVEAGESVRCGNVEGDVMANNVDCGNVKGGIQVGKEVNCKKEKDYEREI